MCGSSFAVNSTNEQINKQKEHKSLDKSVSEMSADRESLDTELAAVTDYFDKIKANQYIH